MATFEYKVAARDGEVSLGRLEAAALEEAVSHLQAQGFVPLQVRPAGDTRPAAGLVLPGRRRHVRPRELTAFTRELATLLGAGIPLDRTLGELATAAENPALVALVQDLQARVRRGSSLAAALEAHPTVFSSLYRSLVQAGETSGALEAVLERLADHLERSQNTREQVTSALIYPAVLVAVAVTAVLLLLAYVVPQFSQMFADVDQSLPLATRIVIGSGELLRDFGLELALLAAAAVIGLHLLLRRPAWRYRWHRLALHVPGLGALLQRVEAARFTATLATLLDNGVGLLEAMRIARGVVGNAVVAERLQRAEERVREGGRLASEIEAQRALPPLAVRMIAIGEESGELATMLGRVAEVHERGLQNGLRRLLSVLEPAMILILGVLVGGIVLSILVAILGVNELVF